MELRVKRLRARTGDEGKLLLIGSSLLWVRIEGWELKGRDMGSEVPFGGQESHLRSGLRITGKGLEVILEDQRLFPEVRIQG